MIKDFERRQRSKFELSRRDQTYDTILVTQTLMVLNHFFDAETKDAVKQVLKSIDERLKRMTLRTAEVLYLYNDEQIEKALRIWKKAPELHVRGYRVKMVNPVMMTNTKARLILRDKLREEIDEMRKQREETLFVTPTTISYIGGPFAKMNFNPRWMDD